MPGGTGGGRPGDTDTNNPPASSATAAASRGCSCERVAISVFKASLLYKRHETLVHCDPVYYCLRIRANPDHFARRRCL